MILLHSFLVLDSFLISSPIDRLHFPSPKRSEVCQIGNIAKTGNPIADLYIPSCSLLLAMAGQQYCLRWNDFQSNMVSSFKHLRSEKNFLDVTLACEGQTCKAHKMVLSACSPYFKTLLEVTVC